MKRRDYSFIHVLRVSGWIYEWSGGPQWNHIFYIVSNSRKIANPAIFTAEESCLRTEKLEVDHLASTFHLVIIFLPHLPLICHLEVLPH